MYTDEELVAVHVNKRMQRQERRVSETDTILLRQAFCFRHQDSWLGDDMVVTRDYVFSLAFSTELRFAVAWEAMRSLLGGAWKIHLLPPHLSTLFFLGLVPSVLVCGLTGVPPTATAMDRLVRPQAQRTMLFMV